MSKYEKLWNYIKSCDEDTLTLTVMENGEHWFHTPEQMAFLDAWITNCKNTERKSV